MFAPELPWDAVLLLSLIVFVPLFSLVLVTGALCGRLARRWKLRPPDQVTWVERRSVSWPAAGILLLYAGGYVWGALVEAHWVETTRTEIAVRDAVLGHDRFRIVHLSDLHLEEIGRRERAVVEAVREAKPHLILLTGDYMNHRGAGAALREFAGALRAEYGVVAAEGNWDPKFITADLFRREGVEFLVDDTKVFEREGKRLRVAALGIEPMKRLRELLPEKDDGTPTIFLHHKPDAVDELRARLPGQRVDLFLCGHTHGGQVCVPFWGAVITLGKYHKKYERGRYDVDGVAMYVHRGVGMEGGAAPRVRFLARPEVAVIDLVVTGAAGPSRGAR
jgi:hypothetical protein